MVIKNCKICGKPFDVRGSALCCSPECSKVNKRNNNKKYNQSPKGKATQQKYNQSPKGKAVHKKAQKKYNQSPKGKATRQKYQQSEKGKATQKKATKKYDQSEKGKATRKEYRQSEKGKAAQKKYDQSDKGKATRKKYEQSEKGKAAHKKANKKYKQSEKGKAAQKRHIQKKIAELNEQYNGDLDSILKDCPNSWKEREAKMQVWFNESYCDGIIAKIESTPVCEVTGESNDLVVHHLWSFNTHPELGADQDNLVLITKEVHNDFHKMFGYGNNTPEQWNEFVENFNTEGGD